MALFSSQRDPITLRNDSDGDLTIKSISMVQKDGPDEEFQACEYGSMINECRDFALPTLAAGEKFDFYLVFYALASETREAAMTIEYSDSEGDKTMNLTIRGFGRVGDDSLPASWFSGGAQDFHKLWGGYNTNHDEAPGPMAVDAQGNMYFAGRATGHVGGLGDADRNVFIVRVNADGTLGWQKVYHSTDHDEIAQTGDNGGLGTADSLDIDDQGNLYLAFKAANGFNKSLAAVMKLDTSDGSEIWTRYWFGDTNRLRYTDAAVAYAVDVEGSQVFMTGTGKSDVSTQGIPVVAYDTAGNLQWSKFIVPQGNTSTAHRGHTVRADGKGNLYVGGIDYSRGSDGPFLAKLSGIDASGTNVKLDWVKTFAGVGTGSNVASMDIDANGDVYMAFERRGATTFFSVVKITANGNTVIGRTLSGSGGDRNNIHALRVSGNQVVVGGRIGLPGWDTGKGDGIIASLNTADLSKNWAGVYYTGSGPDEVCAHSIHGIAVNNDKLAVMGQVYTGNLNYYRYFGYWYDFPGVDEDYMPPVTDTTATTTLSDMPNAAVVDANTTGFANDGVLKDYNPGQNIEFQDGDAKNENSNGGVTDGDVFIMNFTLN